MDKYEVIGEIGKGSFGTISKIIRKADKKILIWKELKYEGIPDEEKQFIENEINLLKEMNHPNIVKQYETINDVKNSKLYIVMEYCNGEDLEKLISKNKFYKNYLNEELIWDILFQTLRALNYIHNEKKILHRDIKPSNIFIDKDFNIKLGDFGLSKKFINEYSNTIIGTPIYMSPELLERKPYNAKTDIWALGCSLYELATFSTPYQAPNMNVLLNKIRNGLPQRIDKVYSDELWNIISKMLTYDYNKRPSSLQLIEDCCEIFISKIRPNRNYYQKKFEELFFFKQQLDKREKELKKKAEELSEKEKMIIIRENSLNMLTNKLKMEEQELNKKIKELEEMNKKFEEKKKELNIKEMQNEKESKMEEFNIQANFNINHGNLSLNDNNRYYLNNDDNNKNNNINKNNNNLSNNQNNFNNDDLFYTYKNLEQYFKSKKKNSLNFNDETLNIINLIN